MGGLVRLGFAWAGSAWCGCGFGPWRCSAWCGWVAGWMVGRLGVAVAAAADWAAALLMWCACRLAGRRLVGLAWLGVGWLVLVWLGLGLDSGRGLVWFGWAWLGFSPACLCGCPSPAPLLVLLLRSCSCLLRVRCGAAGWLVGWPAGGLVDWLGLVWCGLVRFGVLRPGLVLSARWLEWSVVRLDPVAAAVVVLPHASPPSLCALLWVLPLPPGRGPATSSRAARLGAGAVAGEECTEEEEYEEDYGEEDGDGRGYENER